MFNLTKRDSGIWDWEDVLINPAQLVDKSLTKNWGFYTNNGGGSTIIGRSTIIEKNDPFYEEINQIFVHCLNEYILENNLDITSEHMGSGWWLMREYHEGSVMVSHSDAYSYVEKDGEKVTPYLTAILYLNDDYVGGEIAFPNEDVSIKPKAGTVVIFKSSTQHEVKEIISGKRYMTQTYVYDNPFSEYQEMKW